jgi:glycosyltransferase involved in cell wall biosynthesis
MTLLSIVIPTHNRAALLCEILRALEAQACEDLVFEVIVIDGFSTDHTHDVINSHINNGKLSLRYVSSRINSPAAKRNTGIRSASGEWIVFLDDDCIPNDTYLHSYASEVVKHDGSVYALCGQVNYSATLVRQSNYIRYRCSRHPRLSAFQEKSLTLLPPNRIVTMNMAISRALLNRHSLYFNERQSFYGEDLEFGLLLRSQGVSLILVTPMVTHCIPHGSATKWLAKLGARELSIRDRSPLLELAGEMLGRQFVELVLLAMKKKAIRRLYICSSKPAFLFISFFLSLSDKHRLLYFPFAYRLVELLSLTYSFLYSFDF